MAPMTAPMTRFAFSMLLLCLCHAGIARAQTAPVTDGQKAQVEALRAEVAGQIQLRAFDLLDELVYGWNQKPVFDKDTAVVLADVTVPVGFGSGLQSLIETICRETSATLLVVEHDMQFIGALCEEVVVLSFGRKIAEGTPESIRHNEEVQKIYLGEPLPDELPAAQRRLCRAS